MSLLASISVEAASREVTMGVWIRPDEMEGKDPQQICQALNNYGVGAIFMLVPMPPTSEEMEMLSRLRSSLPRDIQVHAWLTVYSNARYLEAHPEEAFQSINGSVVRGWVNPASLAYRSKLVGWVQQIISDLQPSGIFLDYLYVPFGPFDNETLGAFSSFVGLNISASVLTGSEYLLGKFLEWRNGRILDTVKAVKRVIDAAGLKLSIFIRMVEESERLASGQDVAELSRLADFLVPNSYHALVGRDAVWVGSCVQALKAEGAKSVWAGIQGYDVTPIEVNRAVASAVKSGADGVVLFRFGTMTAQHWEQARLALSRTSRIYLWVASGIVFATAVLAVQVARNRKGRLGAAAGRAERRRKRARRR